MAVIDNLFYDIGDTLIVDNKSIMIGVDTVTGYTDVTVGVTGTKFFSKSFRYTVDGLNWSEWLGLTNGNLQAIIPKDNHLFRIKYQYIRSGTDDTGSLEFVSITLNCTYVQQPVSKKFNNLPPSQFFEYFNLQSLQWANNVLEKVYRRGIVPKYIERSDNNNWEDEDYIDLFWSLLYLMAIVVNFGRKFEEIIFDKKTLQEYLRQKGIYLTKDRDLAHLDYLCQNFHSELRKRGTTSIVNFSDNKTVPDGELIRAVDILPTDEFIFCLPETDKSSFTIDKSSPCYRGINGMVNAIKGYEFTKDVNDLSIYPLINSTHVSKISISLGEAILISSVPSSTISGIGSPYSIPSDLVLLEEFFDNWDSGIPVNWSIVSNLLISNVSNRLKMGPYAGNSLITMYYDNLFPSGLGTINIRITIIVDEISVSSGKNLVIALFHRSGGFTYPTALPSGGGHPIIAAGTYVFTQTFSKIDNGFELFFVKQPTDYCIISYIKIEQVV